MDTTNPGKYDVEVNFDASGNVTTARYKVKSEDTWYDFDVDGNILTALDGDGKGMALDAIWDGVSSQETSTVRVKMGKANEYYYKMRDVLSSTSGITKVLENNYEDIIKNIDKKIVEISGYKFCGLGGALRTEFNKSFVDQNLWDENEAKEILKKFPEKCILVTHSPPKFLLDKTIFGENEGSIEILRFIKHKKPKFVFCSHIHEQRGILNFRDTIIINPGYYGMFYTIVEIKNKKIEIKTFKNEVDPIASCTF